MKLFAIYIGGEHPGANIEVHDMRFVVAPSIEETYDTLRRQWWGRPGSLHIDCWSEISHADGYDVSLQPTPFLGEARLYYVNLGGYDGVEFAEKHRNVFVVADTLAQAKTRAIKRARGWDAPHRDEMFEAEQAFALDEAAAAERLYIHLTPSLLTGDAPFTCHYTPLRARRPKASGWQTARSSSFVNAPLTTIAHLVNACSWGPSCTLSSPPSKRSIRWSSPARWRACRAC